MMNHAACAVAPPNAAPVRSAPCTKRSVQVCVDQICPPIISHCSISERRKCRLPRVNIILSLPCVAENWQNLHSVEVQENNRGQSQQAWLELGLCLSRRFSRANNLDC